MIMDGKDEGVYAWITANYLLGTIKASTPPDTPTYSVFELGCASTQIVLEPVFASSDMQLKEGSISTICSSVCCEDNNTVNTFRTQSPFSLFLSPLSLFLFPLYTTHPLFHTVYIYVVVATIHPQFVIPRLRVSHFIYIMIPSLTLPRSPLIVLSRYITSQYSSLYRD